MTMLTIYLVLTQISAEWVEISQQHYRKPIRTYSIHNPFISTDKTEIEDTTSKSRTYKVSSISDYNWTRATENHGYTTNSELRQSSSNDEIENMYDKEHGLDEDRFELKTTHVPTKLPTESGDIDKLKGIKGNVKSVQLKDNSVKSPVINNKNEKYTIRNRYEEYPLDNAENIFEDKKKILTTNENRRIYLNQHYTKVKSTFSMMEDSKYKDSPTQQYKNHTLVENMLLATPTFVTATEELTHYDQLGDFRKASRKKLFITTDTPNLFDEVVTKHSLSIRKQTNNIHKNNLNNIKDRITGIGIQNISKINSAKSNTNANEFTNIQKTTQENNPIPVEEPNIENKSQDLKKDIDKQRKDDTKKSNEKNPQNKVHNMDNLLKFLKAVTDTITQNTRRSFGEKIKYLHDLKNSILVNIAERIEEAWPDEVTTGPRRTSRSMRASPRGQHLYFPSSESALMTISFLTFAVFLIKLVLQLIQTYKNKAMMVAPVMVASTSRTARHVSFGRK